MPIKQGDLRLLETDVAQELLNGNVLARLAYTWMDGTPRVMPIWFTWTGEDLVFGSYPTAPKLKALQQNPQGAATIDTETFPHKVLLVRGPVSVTIQDGVVAEYAAAARRYLGDDGAVDFLKGVDTPGVKMARIALRPTWAGVLDFQTRFPSALGGVLE